MKIVRSKLIGYCHGVDSTIKMAKDCLKKAEKAGLPAYSIGTLIHNQDTVRYFESKGLQVIKGPENVKPGIALIRAHGIPDILRCQFQEAGFTLLDSTCANIRKSCNEIRKAHALGRTIVILGKKGHAESVCLIGTRTEKGKEIPSIFLSQPEDLSMLDGLSKETSITIISQTTFPEDLFNLLVSGINSRFDDVKLGNGLCHACIIRKTKGLSLAEGVDVLIVVGGRDSENTANLAAFLSASGKPVFCIENSKDLTPELISQLKKFKKAGICSGTSTPMEVIDAVCEALESLV